MAAVEKLSNDLVTKKELHALEKSLDAYCKRENIQDFILKVEG